MNNQRLPVLKLSAMPAVMLFALFSIGFVNYDFTYYGSISATPRAGQNAEPNPPPPAVGNVPAQDPELFDVVWEEIGSSPMLPSSIGAPGYRSALTQFSSGDYVGVQHQPNNQQIAFRRGFTNNYRMRYYPYYASYRGSALPSVGKSGDYQIGANYYYKGGAKSATPAKKVAQIKVYSTSPSNWPVSFRG